MAETLHLHTYALLFAGLSALYLYWEASLLIPIPLLVAVHALYTLSTFALRYPKVRPSRRFCTCFVLTFGDLIFTSYMLSIPFGPNFGWYVLIYVAAFMVVQKRHPREICGEMSVPLVRGGIYMLDGFFMAIGVTSGLEAALQQNPTSLMVIHAAVIVVGKQVLTALIYSLDEFFCEAKPVRQIQLDDLKFNVKAGLGIFAILGTVWTLAPAAHPEFTWVAFISSIIYLAWGSLDSIEHQRAYNKIDKE